MFNRFIATLMSLLAALSAMISGFNPLDDYSFTADTASRGGRIENLASNVNVWNMGSMFTDPQVSEEYNIFGFVEYVQLMTATGGEDSRDLFEDPSDRSVKDDYKFDSLLDNCAGILRLGAKPHIKFGNVPAKLSKNVPEDKGGFGVNVYPPEDYGKYYNYIKAIVTALVDRFGADEVRSWHFGVLTEYENADWFRAVDGSPESTATEYCKLYDYTVQALTDVLGEDIYVGAHSMTVTEGLWDEEIFIKHCGVGKNFANGGRGTKISYLSTSFYDYSIGSFTSGMPLNECIAYLRATAEKYGLNGLKIGVDEGRILSGTAGAVDSAIMSRTTGYTWQAAYDARLYGQLIDTDGAYLSSWYYLTNGLFTGNPSVSYHVASQIAKFGGCEKLDVRQTKSGVNSGEVKAFACVEEDGTVRAMAYNFKNTLNYAATADVTLKIKTDRPDGRAIVTVYTIDDSCNYFDEWLADRETYGITDDMFSWSPDDGCCVGSNIINADARKLYKETLEPSYAECCRLVPVSRRGEIRDGVITVNAKIAPNTVVFWEID